MEKQAREARYQEIVDLVEPLIEEITELAEEEGKGSQCRVLVIRAALAGRRMAAFLDQARDGDLSYAEG